MENRTVKEASVEGVQRRTHPKKHFLFCVKVSWSDGTVNLIYRRYSEFLHLQRMLFQAYPGSLNRPGTKRKNVTPLPDSFTTRMNIGEIMFTRMEQVNYFLKEISSLEYNVSQSQHVRGFLTPTQEDLEPRPEPRKVRFNKKKGRRRSSNFTQTVRKLQNFRRTTRVFGSKISSPIVLEHFVVMDDYSKQAKSDINLKKGRVVDVIEKRECGWWLVEADGECGWAPALFLEPADDMEEVSNTTKFAVGRGEIYVTSKRYVAVEDDELSFEIGVNLQILEKNFDGWWKASYLGREGLVPAMLLRKLGNDRRKTGRRKSRLFSKFQLRDSDEDDDETPAEVNAAGNEENKANLPMKIKSAFGKRNSKNPDADNGDGDGGAERKTSKDEFQSIDTMVEMSTEFLQLHKKPKTSTPKESPRPSSPKESPGPATPKESPRPSTPKAIPRPSTPKAIPRPSTPKGIILEKSQTLPARGSPKPTLQRKAISNLIGSSLGLGLSGENIKSGSKDDMALGDLQSRGFGPQSTNTLNDLSHSNSNSIPEDEKDATTCSLKDDENGDFDFGMDLCDMRQESTSSTELAESPDGSCEQPVDLSTHFKTISLGGDSPIFHSPKRSPLLLSAISQSSAVDSPKSPAPRRIPPVPNGSSTFPRRSDAEHEQHDDNTKPASLGRKFIRQRSFEKETSVELNKEMQFWSSSDESEPELAQLPFNKVVHHKTSKSPAIVVYETEEYSTGEKRSNGDEDLNSSTESLEIRVQMSSNKEEFSADVYCAIEKCEVDDEMHLSKGEYVRVLERASTGWWLVEKEDGLKGWAPSNYLCPAPQVNGNAECHVPDEDGVCVADKECRPKMSCRVIEDYRGDPYNQEIDLHKEEFAHILHKSESGWWCIQDEKGNVGWAPSNYLEVFED